MMADKKQQLFFAVLGVTIALLLATGGRRAIPLIVFAAIVCGTLLLAIGPLPRFIASRSYSIRWKILVAIAIIAGLFFFVSLINFGAMDYMHGKVHEIEEIQLTSPRDVPLALDALHLRQHGLLFSLTPLLSLAASWIALCLGIAVALSVIRPVRRMEQAMRTIASGDLSQSIEVENRDELGELASSITATAKELSRLQSAALAEERTRGLRERIAQVTVAQEEERRRISRELHDSLGPSLAAIGNRLRVCQQMLRTDPEKVERAIEEITGSIKSHIHEIRELIYDLRPMALDQLGLVAAVRQLVERFEQETGIRTSFNTSGSIELGPVAEVTAFRIIQECLSNVQKHAQASQVEVSLRNAEDGTLVTVQDNGRGFDMQLPAPSALERGVGLLSMQERAMLLKGKLTVHSSPENGCRVVMYIPRKEADVGTNTSPVGR